MARAQSLTEFELIARYFTRAPRHAVLGVGDDAALLKVREGFELVAATDMMVEGRHFFAGVDAGTLGHKILAVNLSDMAAMGARPRWALLSMALPEAQPEWLEEFARGFFALADRYDVDLVGGDTTRGPRNVCVNILGEVEAGRALRRDGAKAGDQVWVSGRLGEAALGLAYRQGRLPLPEAIALRCIQRLEQPQPRVELGRALLGMAHSAIDISDGLLADLGHICERSGVGARVDLEAVPRARDLSSWVSDEEALRASLAGGDDYELCFSVPAGREADLAALSRRLNLALTQVGKIVPGSGVEVRGDDGRIIEWKDKGFDHFR